MLSGKWTACLRMLMFNYQEHHHNLRLKEDQCHWDLHQLRKELLKDLGAHLDMDLGPTKAHDNHSKLDLASTKANGHHCLQRLPCHQCNNWDQRQHQHQ